MAAKKNNKVARARKTFVQARVQATGKSSAEDRAKFRKRFENLSATQEGRKRIAEVTQVKGIRKELAQTQKKKTQITSTPVTKTVSSAPATPQTTSVAKPQPKPNTGDSFTRPSYKRILPANTRVVNISPSEMAAIEKELYPKTKTPSGVSGGRAAGPYDVGTPKAPNKNKKGWQTWKEILGL
jgi:hypothetical protein